MSALLVDPQANLKAKEFATLALLHLPKHTANLQRLVADGVHIPFIRLLEDQQASPEAKEAAAAALLRLSKDAANLQTLLEADIHTKLGAFLRDPNATTYGREWAQKALDYVLQYTANRTPFGFIRLPFHRFWSRP